MLGLAVRVTEELSLSFKAVAVHTFKPSTREAEAGGSLR